YRFHEEACLAAVARRVHLFIEKPVAQDLPACRRIERAAREAGIRAAVNMSAAFEPEKLAFGRALAEGRAGDVDYIFMRTAWDHAAAAKHRRDDPHPFLAEGGVHALEMLLRYAGSRPARVYNMAWPSAHSVFSGKASNLVSFECENGVRCALEGSWTVRAGISTWRDEYIRADGSRGALQLDCRRLEHLHGRRDQPEGLQHEPIAYDATRDETGGTNVLMRAFLDWISDSRSDHPTDLTGNLQTMALLFAACASADRGEVVDVRDFLRHSL
ncbi:MAG: Gfo/Idh/MocA family protein, partial [Opitutales bacterium]